MRIIKYMMVTLTVIISAATVGAGGIKTRNVEVGFIGNSLNVKAEIILDSLQLGRNRQIFVTPVVSGSEGEIKQLPSLLVNGRNMHVSYERGALKRFKEMKSHKIWKEIKRENGKPQSVAYSGEVAEEGWMRRKGTTVTFVYDSCGCGALAATKVSPEIPISRNPVSEMKGVMVTPTVTALPVKIHEGKARVQFEVDKTQLHAEPYKCGNGKIIDNRDQLRIIDDSVEYALSDPNVEISGISICGYASPESPYLHNQDLATGRSRALAEYLSSRYNLPASSVTYSAVPENWKEFREMVVKSPEITSDQRKALLDLIDSPASTPAEYDRKEKVLKTDKRFASLYRKKILPEWFPRLRATTFAISTRLKPMSDEQLAQVILTSPEKMSLNQMFRVARLYPEGSDKFNEVIATALRFYPNDSTANLNAAAAEIAKGNYAAAAPLLLKAGESPEANLLRGIVATSEEKYDMAADYFRKAGNLPEAERNLRLLK